MVRAAIPDRAPAVDLLVLDIGEVLVDDAFPALLDRIATDSGARREDLEVRYRALSRAYWRGLIAEGALWESLRDCCARPDEPRWRAHLDELLAPRAGAAHVRRWARNVPVMALSNHRAEWIRPVLDRLGLMQPFSAIVISSEHGYAKPDRELFNVLLRHSAIPPGSTLFVDDREENLRTARRLGLQTVQADPDDARIGEVDLRLADGASETG